MKIDTLIFFIALITFSNALEKNTLLKSRTEASNTETDYYSKNADKYLSKKEVPNCSPENCPEPNFCSEKQKACYCAKGLANYPFSGVNGVYCQYEQHSQLTSFLLELLLNLGIGHFIIGQNLMGSFKLIIMVVPIVLFVMSCLGLIKMGFKEGTCGTVVQIVAIAFGVGAFAWWLTDAIMFGKNKYRDRNEVPLKKW